MITLSPFSRSLRTLIAAIAVALLTVTSLFLLVRPADAQETPDVTGSIAGHVVDEGGQPMPGIRVSLYRLSSDYWSFEESIYTNEDGAYLHDYLSTGIYRLRFSDPEHIYHRTYYPDANHLDLADDIPVAGQHVTGLETVMHIGGGIEGQVRLWNDKAPRYVDVDLYLEVGEDWEHVDSFYESNYDHEPVINYQFSGLAPGQYHVEFDASYYSDSISQYFEEFYDNALDHDDATTVNVVGGDTTTAIDAVLGENPTLATVSGKVVSPAGEALPEIQITAYISRSYGWSSRMHTVSDDDGYYTLQALAPNTYTLSFEDDALEYAYAYLGGVRSPELAESMVLTRSQQLTLPNFVMTPTGTISGSVTLLDGAVPETLYVDVYSARTSFTEWESSYSFYDDDGLPAFELRGLAPDTYRLYFSGSNGTGWYSEYYQDALSIDDATDIVVTPRGVVSDVNVALGEHPVYSSISGRVTTVSGLPPVTPISVRALYSYTEYYYLEPWSYWATRRETHTDDQGYYHLRGLLPDEYVVSFENESYEPIYHEQYYDGVDDIDTAERLVLSEGEDRTDVDVVLRSDGIITGVIQLYDGRPLGEYVELTLYSHQEDGWAAVRHDFFDSYDSDTEYVWGALPDGIYRVSAQWGYHGETKFYPDADTVEDADDIEIALDTVTPDISFTFGEDLADARFEGVVTLDGVAQQGLHVEIYEQAYYAHPWGENFWGDWWKLVYMVTNAEGRYAIDGLEAGYYRICVSDPSGVLDRYCHLYSNRVSGSVVIPVSDGQVITDFQIEMNPDINRLYLPDIDVGYSSGTPAEPPIEVIPIDATPVP